MLSEVDARFYSPQIFQASLIECHFLFANNARLSLLCNFPWLNVPFLASENAKFIRLLIPSKRKQGLWEGKVAGREKVIFFLSQDFPYKGGGLCR